MNISELSDIQSESGVIGTLIYHPEYIAHTEFLKPNYFFGTENACIYWAIQSLYSDGITNIDAYNISNKLQSNKGVSRTIEKYNLPSVQEFLELYKGAARTTLEEYKMLAQNIVTLAFKRDLIKSLNQVETNCYKQDFSLEKLNGLVYSELDALTQKYIATSDIHTLGDDIEDIWQEIVSRRTADGICGMPSKFPALMDYFTYEPGELVVVQAPPKNGKSVFLMNEAVHKLQNGVPTLVVDTEMSTRLYTERLLSHLTLIDMRRIKNGNYDEHEAKRIQKAIEWIKTHPLVHINEPDLTMDQLYSICKMLQHKMGLGFVVYDYMKSNEKSTGDNYNILGSQCDFLKNQIASKLEIPVLSACQLNREGEVADSAKINRYLSVAVKWGLKTRDTIAKDGLQCGNAHAKIYVNRNGQQMYVDDTDDYLDFVFSGNTMTIEEAEQHQREDDF